MDTSNASQKAAHLLDDLESIRQLLGDDGLQPPLLTEMVGAEGAQIPLLSEAIDDENQIPLVGIEPAPTVQKQPDALLVHLDNELRTAAHSIMQDVINDFTPHIETEIKRRLEAHMERLLAQR